MSARRITITILPILLLLSLLLPVYVLALQTQAINYLVLIKSMPIALMAPIILLLSLYFALQRHAFSGLFSSLLGVAGLAFICLINATTDQNAATPQPYTAIIGILYFLVVPMAYLSVFVAALKARRKPRLAAIPPQPNQLKEDVGLFDIPFRRFYILYVVTNGVYGIYWAYQNWRALRGSEPAKISPFWRALFNIFYIIPLFTRILERTQKQGYEGTYSPAKLALVYYVFLLVIPNVVSFIFGISLISLITGMIVLLVGGSLFRPAQRAIHASQAKAAVPHKTTKAEVFVVVLGILVYAGSMMLYFSPHLLPRFNMHAALSPQAEELKTRAARLSQDYDQCTNALQAQYKTLDTTSQKAVDDYNTQADVCEHIRVEQNQAAHDYNKLIGIEK